MTSTERSRITGQVYKTILKYHKERYTKTTTYKELLKCDDKEAMMYKIKYPDISIFPVSNLVVINPFTPIEYTISINGLRGIDVAWPKYKQELINDILK